MEGKKENETLTFFSLLIQFWKEIMKLNSAFIQAANSE